MGIVSESKDRILSASSFRHRSKRHSVTKRAKFKGRLRAEKPSWRTPCVKGTSQGGCRREQETYPERNVLIKSWLRGANRTTLDRGLQACTEEKKCLVEGKLHSPSSPKGTVFGKRPGPRDERGSFWWGASFKGACHLRFGATPASVGGWRNNGGWRNGKVIESRGGPGYSGN